MTPLKVLFWFRRQPETRGGDWTALKHYVAALRAQQIDADISDNPAHDLTPYAFAHIYNSCDPYLTLEYAVSAAQQNKAFVVTPIYWDHAQWFQTHAHATPETRPEFFLGKLSEQEWRQIRFVQAREHELFMAVQQLTLRAASIVFSLSDMEGALVTRDFGVSKARLCTTYNGVDLQYAHGDAARFVQTFGARDFVFCAARLEERKNTVGLIRAWRNEQAPLVLAGHAPDVRYLDLCRAEATGNIHFVGALTPAHVADAFAAARVHVMASWWEEQGLAALEAGLNNLNLVMTQNGPGREYFGDACFSCDPADPISIREAIRRALAAPRPQNLRAQLAEKFTWARAAQQTRAAYDAALQTDALRAPFLDTNALGDIGARLAELMYLKQTAYETLETQALKTTAWAHELETIVRAHARAHARWTKSALVRTLQAWRKRD
jgi:glycosyltransferase involved in cell wall biosynthesis